MSQLFNQTNITPGTSFSGSGGGGLNPTFASITAANNPTNYITMSDPNGNMRSAVGVSTFVVSFNSPTDTRVELRPTNGNYIAFWGTNDGSIWAQGNNQVGNGYGLAMRTMSSMTATGNQPGVIDMNGLVSTLKSVYPPIVK